MNYTVEIENLSKDYEVGFWKKRKVRALDNLNLQVEGGQIFGFLGGNGAGKNDDDKNFDELDVSDDRHGADFGQRHFRCPNAFKDRLLSRKSVLLRLSESA